MHRNTYVNGPAHLDPFFRLEEEPRIRLAGQITGVEGYLESAAVGLMVGSFTAQELAEYYERGRSWDGVSDWLFSTATFRPGRGARSMNAMAYVLADASGVVVADTSGVALGRRLSGQDLIQGLPVNEEADRGAKMGVGLGMIQGRCLRFEIVEVG